MVIFLKYSIIAKIKGIISRYLKNRGKERKEIQGCKEQMSFEFLKQTINWNKTKLNSINEALEKNKDKKIIIFKNRKN